MDKPHTYITQMCQVNMKITVKIQKENTIKGDKN